MVSPTTYCNAGSGTEGSPYTSADNTGGMQGAIDALAAGRGGLVSVPASRFDATAHIVISTPAIQISGEAAGANIDPNGLYEGITGTKIRRTLATSDIFKIAAGNGKLGGLAFRNLYLWGAGNDLRTNVYSGFYVEAATDQPLWDGVFVANQAYGWFIQGEIDSGVLRKVTTDGCGYGIWVASGASVGYAKILESCFADMQKDGVHVQIAGFPTIWLTIADCSFVRCNQDTTAGQACYLGCNQSIVANCVFQNNAADGLVLAGNGNLVKGCQFINQQTAGKCAIRVLGNNNVIDASFAGNATDIIIAAGATGTVIHNSHGLTIADGGTGTLYPIVPVGAPSTIIGIGRTVDLSGNPVAAATITARMTTGPGTAGFVINGADTTFTSDGSGNLYVQLIQGATYRLYGGQGSSVQVTAPSSGTTFTLGEIVTRE